MADERVDHRRGDDRGITRRAAIGTGIATAGLGALWASPLASASTTSDPPRAAIAGKVTVFNCYSEPIDRLLVNGDSVGDIAAWSEGGANRPPKYTPASLTVPRSKAPEPKSIAIGDNDFRIDWGSFDGRSTILVPSPAQSPITLNDDLLLFVAINEATLMDDRGFVWGRAPVRRVGR
jgi:hypothetical protein